MGQAEKRPNTSTFSLFKYRYSSSVTRPKIKVDNLIPFMIYKPLWSPLECISDLLKWTAASFLVLQFANSQKDFLISAIKMFREFQLCLIHSWHAQRCSSVMILSVFKSQVFSIESTNALTQLWFCMTAVFFQSTMTSKYLKAKSLDVLLKGLKVDNSHFS